MERAFTQLPRLKRILLFVCSLIWSILCGAVGAAAAPFRAFFFAVFTVFVMNLSVISCTINKCGILIKIHLQIGCKLLKRLNPFEWTIRWTKQSIRMTLVFNSVPLSFRSESILFRSKWIAICRRPFISKTVCCGRGYVVWPCEFAQNKK